MTSKTPAGVNYRDENDPLKKLYNAIDELNDIIPVPNERNRLSFCINLYLNKEVDNLMEAIVQASPRSSVVSWVELEKKILEKFKEKGI
jgi:hypothetical protein